MEIFHQRKHEHPLLGFPWMHRERDIRSHQSLLRELTRSCSNIFSIFITKKSSEIQIKTVTTGHHLYGHLTITTHIVCIRVVIVPTTHPVDLITKDKNCHKISLSKPQILNKTFTR